MRSFSTIAMMIFASTLGFAQNDATPEPTGTATTIVARTGVRMDTPIGATYHFLESWQTRGSWIVPDIGYIDFGRNNYREIFAGGGRVLAAGKKGFLLEELYYDQSFGPAGSSAKYLQFFTAGSVTISQRWSVSGVYFPYLPLNSTARIQHVLENAKIERSLPHAWKLGAGYAGYSYGDEKWENKPFVTATYKVTEIWLQKLPGGAQVQLRLNYTYTKKR